MSVLLRTEAAAAPGTAPIRVGLAAAGAIEAVCGIAVQLKWPNDLIVDGRKLGGVLCEASTTGSTTSIVAGVGINVAQREDDFSEEIRRTATSLWLAGCPDVRRATLAGQVLQRLLAFDERIARPMDAGELAGYAARDALLGHPILVDDRPAGIAAGLTPQGELRVRTDAGVATVHTGRVRIAGAPAVAQERAP